MSTKRKKKKAKLQDEWGNRSTHKVFCERPDLHNYGETEAWKMRCAVCDHKYLACLECVMDGDCCCPNCTGTGDQTEAQATKTVEDIAIAALGHKFGVPRLN